MVPVVMGVATLTVGGLVLTGHTSWLPIRSSTVLASRTICSSGQPCLDERSVDTDGRWTRRTIEGTVARGTLRRGDLQKLEAAANSSAPPQASVSSNCKDPIGYTIAYRWRYEGRTAAVSQARCAATPLPVENELERLAYKLD